MPPEPIIQSTWTMLALAPRAARSSSPAVPPRDCKLISLLPDRHGKHGQGARAAG